MIKRTLNNGKIVHQYIPDNKYGKNSLEFKQTKKAMLKDTSDLQSILSFERPHLKNRFENGEINNEEYLLAIKQIDYEYSLTIDNASRISKIK